MRSHSSLRPGRGRLAILIVSLIGTAALAQDPPAQHRPAHKPPAVQAAPSATAYKGFLEPANYPQDVDLRDVFFTSAEEGWASGDHGTIIHTADGGHTWVAQLGGTPDSTDPMISMLRFVDNRHGWAVLKKDAGNDSQVLLRTEDGQNWSQVGGIPSNYQLVDYQFSTPTNGVAINGNGNFAMFWRTRDGGRTWRQVIPSADCHARVLVNGLSRDAACAFEGVMQFVSMRVAYAVGHVGYTHDTLLIGKTTDGGNTWTFWGMQDTTMNGLPRSIAFADENHGFVDLGTQIYATTDGAKTWHPLLGTVQGIVRFADPETAWGLDRGVIYYSVNGARSWRSFGYSFPADPNAFSFPRRDCVYIVGGDGMVYRYRIVPKDYKVAHGIDAPLMPAFGGQALASKADAIRRDIAQLRSKLPPAQPGASAQGAGAAPSSGGFAQDVSSSGSAPASGASGGGFAQDAAAASPAVADCCGAALQTLQSDTAAFAQQAPAVASQYQPLNLVIAGTQLVSTLTSQALGLWNTFLAFKHAPTQQAASAALQQLSTGVNTTNQTASTGLQNPGSWMATNAPADFVQDVGSQ
ncbi:MAG TPA: YCF48-related protein [Candidatus Acidoferrum sp.]|nr:YCF48-related protein [Candidatus Acidoferrum sp.]